MTGRDLIASSLRLIGALASGDSLASAEATDGLAALIQLMDSWSTESLLIPNKVREVFSLTADKQTYTMGTGGDFNTARPMEIEQAMVQLPGTSPVAEIPIKILIQAEYARITQKTIESTFPLYLYSDDNYPLANLSFWMVPNQTVSIALYSWKPLTALTLDTAISLPPGYERALKYALALDLAPEYGKQLQDIVVLTANESKAAIKRMNSKPRYLQVDEALRSKPAVWNWLTGEPQ